MHKPNKRDTIVMRKDNGQIGVVYKDSGEILSIITLNTGDLCCADVGNITTWHESKVYILPLK